MSRWFLGIGPALLLVSCAAAFAQDVGAAGPGATTPTGMPSADFLLSLGPYGALVWGAYLLGKGVKVTVQVELSERDRELIEHVGRGQYGLRERYSAGRITPPLTLPGRVAAGPPRTQPENDWTTNCGTCA